MYKRAIYNALLEWSKSDARKPLVLRGARQVGKTTIVVEFAKTYPTFIHLNLDKKEDCDLFKQNLSIENLIAAIHFHKNLTINRDVKTLLFIDEIQNSPNAVAMLRYFYEEANDIHVIAAGSLLETLIDSHISFPVGRVEYKWLYPFSFTEFLLASNELQACKMLSEIPCPQYAHNKLLKLFHDFAFVGAMPEAIKAYLPDKDFVKSNHIHENILTAFVDDVEKYAPNRTFINIIRHAILHAPIEAGSRIKFQGFGNSNYKSREMGEAFRLLEKAMLLQLIYPTVNTSLPASPNFKKSPKLHFLDTGLINYAVGLGDKIFTGDDLNNIYKGRLTENIVGQELLNNNMTFKGNLRFWVREKSQASSEIDFVIPYKNLIIPVEVKSGKSGTLKSLLQYMEIAEHRTAIRLYAGTYNKTIMKTNSGKSFNLYSLPYYQAGILKEFLSTLQEI